MKRCPKCKRVENDDALVFCRADGTPLVSDLGSASTEIGTVKFGSAPTATEVVTSILPQHATDADINRATGSTTVLDHRAISRTREHSRRKRTKAITFAVAAIFIVAIAGLTYYYYPHKRNAAINSIAVLPLQNASGDPSI